MPRRTSHLLIAVRYLSHLALLLLLAVVGSPSINAQDTVTGAFQGTVTASDTGDVLKDAVVEIINQQTNVTVTLKTNYQGQFFQGLLLPGTYIVRVSMANYATKAVLQVLRITYAGEVVPVPVALDPVPPGTNQPAPTSITPSAVEENDIRASIITVDGRRSGSYVENEIVALPLGGITTTRSFDELALLLPGVAPPPQTLGSVAGPGVGAGVGSAGQFSVNGLRSRANNFTVDGSDNNDEDIGVRRQGFVALIPQPVESIREYQLITLLAPAQFGRNIGGQVNAVSKTGGNVVHGAVWSTFNSDRFNARNFFDTLQDNATAPVLTENNQPVLLNGVPLLVSNTANQKDKFTYVEAGFVLGGPIKPNHLFYFASYELRSVNATKEESFAVPTIEERGAFRTGSTGIFVNPFTGLAMVAVPASRNGSAIFNLFPFPNNVGGIFGQNTFSRELPADQKGSIGSLRLDHMLSGVRPQSFAGRYNFSEDNRIVPMTGGALFSTLKARIRTQNLSLFWNSQLSGLNANASVFNQLRLSYGRTRLAFSEVRDHEYLIASEQLPNEPFLLNGPLMLNVTQPTSPGVANTGPVNLISPVVDVPAGVAATSIEQELGLLGQVNIAGFSPIGVDVFNFAQNRINNTYQVADDFSINRGNHSMTFGVDLRRSELNSDLPRNARSLVTFNGAPRLIFDNGALRFPTSDDPSPIVRPEDLAALGAASNFFLTLNKDSTNSAIGLRFYQINAFGQDFWQLTSNLSLAIGLRYEYNTPVREVHDLIENTFDDPAFNLAPGLRQFVEGRTKIYETDKTNFGPRIGFAYSPSIFGKQYISVMRGGYGLFFDQIPGAVASQSRNVYPTYLNLNFGGLISTVNEARLVFFNPGQTFISSDQGLLRLQLPGTLNRYNPALPLNDFIDTINLFFPSALGATLAASRLRMPRAHHYSLSFEQQVTKHTVVSAAYVGTSGSHLLRFSTPNLGPALSIAPSTLGIEPFLTTPGLLNLPEAFGRVNIPARPVPGIGAINRFETSARSRYNALQIQARGRLTRTLFYQMAYVLSSARDDVSDVFDLAGAFALPQNSISFAGERGPANFDARHRFTYNVSYNFSDISKSTLGRMFFNDLEISSIGQLQTGSPFTVNSLIDINLDGNLTDRLDTTNGVSVTGNGAQPLSLTTTNTLGLLAPFGQDGRIPRNLFRAAGLVDTNVAISKRFALFGHYKLSTRIEILNFINRVNFGVPVRVLEAPGFGKATNTITPARQIRFGLKFVF